MMMAVWKFAPAIAAGNTVVLKPVDTTPVSTRADGRDHGRVPAARRVQRRLRGPRHRTGAGRAPDPGDGVDHRLGAGRHGGRRPRRPRTSSACTSSSGARRPVVVFDDADLARPPRRASRSPATSTPGRTAPPRPGCSPGPASTTTSSPRWPSRRRDEDHCETGAGRRGRARPGRSTTPASSTGCRASSTALPDHADGRRRRQPASATAGYFYRAHRRRRPAAGRRDDPGRGVRPGHHRAALHRRGRGGALGQRRASTGWRPRVWTKDHGRAMRMAQAARLRLRVDQHPHPAGRRDAARWLQALAATARTCRCTGSRTTPGSST